MKNNNLLQKIGITIIIVSWSARLIGKFLDAETAKLLSDFSYLSLIGIGIWTVGYFRQEKECNK